MSDSDNDSWSYSRTFFIYDHEVVKKESDDPKMAIVYFYQPHDSKVSDNIQVFFCGQLMGMVDCLRAVIGSKPRLYKFRRFKIAVLHKDRFTIAMGSSVNTPNDMVLQKVENFYKLFQFYHGSLNRIFKQCRENRDEFSSKIATIMKHLLLFIRHQQGSEEKHVSRHGDANSHVDKVDTNMQAGEKHHFEDRVRAAFQPIPVMKSSKKSPLVFLKASHLLQWLKRQPQLLAGCLLYKHKVLCTQLTPELTRNLLLINTNHHHIPAISVNLDFDLPVGARMLSVFLTNQEFSLFYKPPAAETTSEEVNSEPSQSDEDAETATVMSQESGSTMTFTESIVTPQSIGSIPNSLACDSHINDNKVLSGQNDVESHDCKQDKEKHEAGVSQVSRADGSKDDTSSSGLSEGCSSEQKQTKQTKHLKQSCDSCNGEQLESSVEDSKDVVLDRSNLTQEKDTSCLHPQNCQEGISGRNSKTTRVSGNLGQDINDQDCVGSEKSSDEGQSITEAEERSKKCGDAIGVGELKGSAGVLSNTSLYSKSINSEQQASDSPDKCEGQTNNTHEVCEVLSQDQGEELAKTKLENKLRASQRKISRKREIAFTGMSDISSRDNTDSSELSDSEIKSHTFEKEQTDGAGLETENFNYFSRANHSDVITDWPRLDGRRVSVMSDFSHTASLESGEVTSGNDSDVSFEIKVQSMTEVSSTQCDDIKEEAQLEVEGMVAVTLYVHVLSDLILLFLAENSIQTDSSAVLEFCQSVKTHAGELVSELHKAESLMGDQNTTSSDEQCLLFNTFEQSLDGELTLSKQEDVKFYHTAQIMHNDFNRNEQLTDIILRSTKGTVTGSQEPGCQRFIHTTTIRPGGSEGLSLTHGVPTGIGKR